MMNPEALAVLESLSLYEDFMEGIEVVADMGAGDGDYAKWWAERKDSKGKPLNYMVMAIDDKVQLANLNRRSNVRQIRKDWNDTGIQKGKIDFVWCFDSFQYATYPFDTLKHWWDIMREDAMLLIAVPQTSYIDDLSRWQIESKSGCYNSWNIVTLVQTLAVSGFDCREGFLRQRRHDPWLWVAAYKSKHAPMDPTKTTWYELADKKLIPITAEACVEKLGYLRHDQLVVEWLDHQRYSLAVESIP